MEQSSFFVLAPTGTSRQATGTKQGTAAATVRTAMAPKKARVEFVDGVHCSHNLASGIVIVGTGLVSHDKRDCFKLKAGGTLEEQVRARPKFAALAAAAVGGDSAGESQQALRQHESPPSQAAAPQEQAQPAAGILFGGSRQPPSQRQYGPHALMPAKLESDLGVAWDFTTEEREQAKLAAEEQRKEEQRQRIEARREKERQREAVRKRARKESEPVREPCLCTRAGAIQLLNESQQQTRDGLKLAAAANEATQKIRGTLTAWLQKKSSPA
jgi:hypothetical protein